MEDLSISDDNGQLRPNYRPRAQPVAIAGTPVTFTESLSGMELRWQHNAALGATELFIAPGFANGKQLITQGGWKTRIRRF
jgi:hypothetical protein